MSYFKYFLDSEKAKPSGTLDSDSQTLEKKMATTKIAKGISMSCVTVSSLEETKRLFSDLLGLEVKEYAEDFKWMELEGEEGGRVGFGEPMGDGMKAGTNGVVSISVDNVDEARAFLESKEIQF